MNAGRREEIEMVAQSLQMSGEFVPAPMLRELLADVDALTQERDAYRSKFREMEHEVELIRGQLIALTQERDEYRTAYLNEQKLSGSYHVLWQTQEDDIARLTAELASYKRQAAYISSVIDSEGKYVP